MAVYGVWVSCFVPLIIIVGTLRICEGNYGYGNFGKNQVQSKINLQLEGDANKKVLGCYFQDYAIYRTGGSELKPDKIDPFLCSFIIYFVGNLVSNQITSFDPWADVDLGGFLKATDLKKANPKLKVIIAVGGWNMGSVRFSKLSQNPASRKKFIDSVIAFCEKWNFDGLDIDWEYPGERGGIRQDYVNFPIWLKELREAFNARTKETGKVFMLTAALGASVWIIDDAYNVPEIFKYLDYAQIMTYDFHMGTEGRVAHHSPLYNPPKMAADDPDYNPNFNADWAMQHYLALGAPASKLLLGLPLYGRGFRLADPKNHSIGAGTSGPNDAGPFLQETGFLGITEICLLLKNKGWVKGSEYNLTYAYGNGQWIGYDDETSMQRKTDYIWKNQLAGGFVWALDYEDCNQLCNTTKNPLLTFINKALKIRPPGNWVPATTPKHITVTPLPSNKPNKPWVTGTLTGENGSKVLGCYYQDYAIYRPGGSELKPDKIDPNLCSIITYFVGNLVGNEIKSFDPWADVDLGGFKKVTGLKNQNALMKVLVAIGGWNMGSTVFSYLAESPANRQKFTTSVIKFLERWNFDGLDIDWEYPTQRGGVKQDYVNFPIWLKELREAFDNRTKQTGKEFMLTAALGASVWVIDDAYSIPEIFKYLDYANIMTYDFHMGTEGTVAHHSPLYNPIEDDYSVNSKYTTDWAINHYISLGAPPKKLLLGVPLYGRGFKLADPENHFIGAQANGPNTAGPFLKEAGFLGITEICLLLKNHGWNKSTDLNMTYAYGDGQWIGYDDENSVVQKALYIWEKQLGGGFIWALDYEDNNQLCGGGKNPVLNAFNKALTKRPPGNSLPPALNHSISLTGPTGAPLVYGTLNGTNTSKVLGCYYQDYAIYRPGGSELKPSKIDPKLCSIITYFVGNLMQNQIVSFDSWADVDLGGFLQATDLKKKNPVIRVLIAVGGWNMGSTVFSELVKSDENRKKFTGSLIPFLEKWNFDGLDLDWEYPTQRGGTKQDYYYFVTWIKELREAFNNRTAVTGKKFMLTAALSASVWTIDDAYNVPEIFKYLDYGNIMTYDFHMGSEPIVVHHSPLYSPPKVSASDINYNPKYSSDWAMQHFLALGAPASKLLMGVPLYGRGFRLADANNHTIGSAARGPNDPGPFLRESGFLGITEICLNIKNKGWVKGSDYDLPYAYGDGQWIGYDDESSVRRKAQYIWENQLAGGFIWALDYEDNNQLCGTEKNPVLSALNQALRQEPKWIPAPAPTRITVKPPLTPAPTPAPSTSAGPKELSNVTTSPLTTTTGSLVDTMCTGDGWYQYPGDCSRFIRCATGHMPAAFSCSPPLLFDESVPGCNWPEVTACRSTNKNLDSEDIPLVHRRLKFLRQ